MPSAQMNQLLIHVRELVPYIRRQVERPLLGKFKTLGWILTSLVMLFSFIRVIRENEGATTEVYFWIGRAAIFLFLFGFSSSIISTMYKIGRTLTIPIENGIEEKRIAFNDNYYKFVHGTMVIEDSKQVMTQPNRCFTTNPDGTPGCWVGILTDTETTSGKLRGLTELAKGVDKTSWDMNWLFYLLNGARAILQFAEVFLLLLGGFVMIALRLTAPFMVAVGIDKKLAERVTYPFLWGTVVFTLIFPVVRDVITYIAYTVGSFGLMLYKGEAIYSIDEQTAELIKNNPYDPTFVIFITLITMTIAGLMLCLSPYIAYRLSTGQVFEAVSSTASGWMAAMLGSYIEFKGLKAGASLQREAENTQVQGAYSAEMTRAKANFDAGNLGAQARKVSGLASIQAGLTTQLGQIWGGARQAVGMASATRNFTVAQTNASVWDSQRQTLARRDQSVGQNNINYGIETLNLSTENQAKTKENIGAIVSGFSPYGQPVFSGTTGLFSQHKRNFGANQAAQDYRFWTNRNEYQVADRITGSQDTYAKNVGLAADNMYAESRQSIMEGAGVQAGAAKQGAGIASGGVNKAYQLEIQANQVQYGGTTEAARITREANFEAARDRQIGTLVSGMSRDMSRRIEESMRQRY